MADCPTDVVRQDPANDVVDVLPSVVEKSATKPTEEYNCPADVVKQDPANDAVVLPSVAEKSATQQTEEYNVGNIVWAKLGRFPHWPSVVCHEPGTKTYIKITKTKKVMIHVRFCNDNGRRSWLTLIENRVENYRGKLDFLKKYPKTLSSMKNSKKLLNSWNLAVEEAERLQTLDRPTRLTEFLRPFLNSDKVNIAVSTKDKSVEDKTTASSSKVLSYSRKNTYSEVDKNSDDSDSIVSKSSDDVFIKTKRKKRSANTFPPKRPRTKKNKSSKCNSADESDYVDETNEVDEVDETPTNILTRLVPTQSRREINLVEVQCVIQKKENLRLKKIVKNHFAKEISKK